MWASIFLDQLGIKYANWCAEGPDQPKVRFGAEVETKQVSRVLIVVLVEQVSN